MITINLTLDSTRVLKSTKRLGLESIPDADDFSLRTKKPISTV